MDEKTLIEFAKNEDKKALSRLLSDNYHIVFSYLLKLTRNDEIARDITQDTMVKAILNIKKFNNTAKFSTWLITIASNQYKNLCKRNKKILPIGDEALLYYLENRDHTHSTEEIVLLNEAYLVLLKQLDTFKYSQKMPLMLRHYYGYSYEEISSILKIPIGTVKSRIHNTIKKLQLLMKEGHDENL